MTIAQLLAPNAEELAEHYPNRAERAADGWVHGLGFLGAAIGGGILLAMALERGGVPLATGAAIYALCLMAMLAASAVYNLTKPSPARRLLRRIDEAGIFLMIAGSYTPFTIQLLPPALAFAVTFLVWAMALAGAGGKVLWPHLSDRFWCLVYLAFGWLAVFVLGPIASKLPPLALGFLIAAGLTYSGGVLLYLNHAIPFRRAIWHGCVVVGAAAHYGAVLLGLVLSST
ncbi:MAG: hemolysin III family protein [Hyphomonadaceae bacterium]